MRKIFLLFLFLGISNLLQAQCPDFTNLYGSGVTCHSGTFWDPMQDTGIDTERHLLITQQGSDIHTGFQLPYLPPGESVVIRLGNDRVGAEAEAITYRFTVDPDHAILLLKFAVVFEDPGHPSPSQPRFVVRVLNGNGQLMEDCAEYDVTAAGDIPGFQSYRHLRWRPWTNVGIDMSRYAGQSVQVQFLTYDCAWNGHFGYAYFTASCIDSRLSLDLCDGDQVTLSAPEGFDSYLWDNGSTSVTATYTVNGTTMVNCPITSATGCQFTLCGTITTNSDIPSTSDVIYDTIWEGDIYQQHYFNLPPQYETGTHSFRNTFFNPATCTDGEVTTTLFLTVKPRFNHIYDEACQGGDYHSYGFQYTDLQPGVYIDTITTVIPTGGIGGTVLHLNVSPSFSLPNTIVGETTVCRHEIVTYSLPHAQGLTTFHWNVPDGVIVLTGQGTETVNLFFTEDAPSPAIITLTGANGCGNGSIPLNVTSHPTYHLFFQDSICTGSEYHGYGFDLARQDSIGWFSFIQNHTTSQGCDSVRILQLLVTKTPTLTTLAQPAEICPGQEASVHALGENAGIIHGGQGPAIAIGDILCTDNTTVKLSEWPSPGKTALGIVFYVDITGQHGWAVHLQDQNSSIKWASNTTDITTLTNYQNAYDALFDRDGYTNTQRIRAAGNANTYPAAYAVDFARGWYLPAAGQLRLLYAELETLNASLQAVGGTPFPMDANWYYWSSTEFNSTVAFNSDNRGYVYNDNKSSNRRVRSIRNF